MTKTQPTILKSNQPQQASFPRRQSPKRQPSKVLPSREIEESLLAQGYFSIVGIDEAGRGAFAGPLVAAGVILSEEEIVGIDDSKRLTAKKRLVLAEKIKQSCRGWYVSIIEPDIINKLGIQRASYQAYQEIVNKINPSPDHILIDYYRIPKVQLPQIAMKFGDQISLSIAAASIIAKVERDILMIERDQLTQYRDYGFALHKGYGTKLHREIIRQKGISDQHRIKYCQKCVDINPQEKFNFTNKEKNV